MWRALFLLVCALGGPVLALAADPMRSILLVARKDMRDPNFRDSVVLVLQGPAAPMGVIINKPLEIPLSKALPRGERLGKRDDRLFYGGPVQLDEVVFVFRSAKAREDVLRVTDDIYLGWNREILDELLARDEPLEGLRIFAGHAGWAPGQLESEIARGDWHLERADAAAIFGKRPERLWPELIRKASGTKIRFETPRRSDEQEQQQGKQRRDEPADRARIRVQTAPAVALHDRPSHPPPRARISPTVAWYWSLRTRSA